MNVGTFTPFEDGKETAYQNLTGMDVVDVDGTSGVNSSYGKPSVRLVRSSKTGRCKIDGQSAFEGKYEAGAVYFIPADAHVFVESDPYDITFFSIDEKLISEAAGRPIPFNNWQIKLHPAATDLANAVRAIAMEPSAPEPILRESVKMAFVASLVRHIDPALTGAFEGPLRKPAYRRVVDYIEANYSRSIGLSDLASAAAMSRFAFARAWRETTGTTPMQFVLSRRIAHAKRMLANEDIPIIHVALACGFSSHSHMTTVFGKVTGETPTAYRHRMTR